MVPDTLDRSRPALSAEALSEWNDHVESVMRGMAHALNNRAAALSALMEFAGSPEDAAIIGPMLATELQRVQDLVAVVRSISAPKSGTDAFAPADAAAEAEAILRLHVAHRDHDVVIDAKNAPPVRLERWMFVRALVALGAATSPREAPKVVCSGSDEWVVARLNGSGAPSGTATAYVSELAAAMGGAPLPAHEGNGFRVPTLAAIRQREGRGA